MSLAPGSFAWLLAHDLRLSWRRFRAVFRKLSLLSTFCIILTAEIVFHLMAIPAASWFGELEAASDPSAYHAALIGGLLIVLSWMTAQALTGSTRALHARGELDIVLASPVSARNVVTARAVTIAAEAVGSVAILVTPVINMNIVAGRTHWLSAYPMLVACGLIATTIGLSGAIGLFAFMGPRRARLVSQIAAAVIGGGFVLAVQIANLLPQSVRDGVAATLSPVEQGDVAEYGSLVSTPLQAADGDIGAILALMAVGLGVFGLVSSLLGERFARTAVASAGMSTAVVARSSRSARGFQAGAGRALRRKELLLVMRDPWLISQIFLQIVYVLPIAVILLHGRGTAGSLTLSVGPAIVVVASQLSGAFAWLVVSGEDAPDLLASAPLTRGRIERGKIEAIALPIGSVLAVPLIWIATIAPRAALVIFIFTLSAATASACLNLWHPVPGKRGEMMRRHQQSKLVGMVEHLLSLLFAVACVLALLGTWLAALPIGFALTILWLNRGPRHKGASALPPLVSLSAARVASRS